MARLALDVHLYMASVPFTDTTATLLTLDPLVSQHVFPMRLPTSLQTMSNSHGVAGAHRQSNVPTSPRLENSTSPLQWGRTCQPQRERTCVTVTKESWRIVRCVQLASYQTSQESKTQALCHCGKNAIVPACKQWQEPDLPSKHCQTPLVAHPPIPPVPDIVVLVNARKCKFTN